MRPIVNMPEEDRATDIGNMHKNGKDRVCGSGDILSDRQPDRRTDTQTDALITILRNSPLWRKRVRQLGLRKIYVGDTRTRKLFATQAWEVTCSTTVYH